jgi:2-polyprenyl-6-methoxyphenol hydroxylase-like FAD-dependent oxidoreductase
MRPLRIAVAGAGTAGLAAAAFLARAGHRVRLFERFDRPKPVGAGLLLQPTGLACLAQLGLDAAALGYGQPIHTIYGKTRAGRPNLDLSYRELGTGVFGLGIHRGALFFRAPRRSRAAWHWTYDGNRDRRQPRNGRGRILVDRQNHEHGVFELLIDATGVRSPLRTDAASLRRERPYAHGAVWGSLLEPADWPLKDRLLQRYVRRQMACTLAGMKTGVFMHIDPGRWHPAYALPRLTTDTPPAAVPAAARDSAPALGRSEVGHDR